MPLWYTSDVTRKSVAALAVLAMSAAAMPAPALAQPDGATPTLVAGAGAPGFSGDGGPAAEAKLNRPLGAAVAADGSVYIADTLNRRVRVVGKDGIIRTVAGNGRQTVPASVPAGTKGTGIALSSPNAVAAGSDGTVFIADSAASRVYALAADGSITVRVDADVLGGSIATINAIAVAPSGTLYLADRENNRVVEIAPGAGSRPLSTPVNLPTGLAADAAGDLWITSASSVLSRLHDGKLATIIDTAGGGWRADENRAALSPFNASTVSAGTDGVYLVDNQQRTVRRLGTDASAATVAGLPADPFGTRDPIGLAAGTASAGPLYVVDTVGSRIFSMPVTVSAGDSADGDPKPVWPWALGGAAVLVLGAVFFLVSRRRRA
ncbi:Tripartite motif-containing protein 71 [Actinoplanes sp. SE50]|uniref:NHL domain-containing protein n=1 Tax=unclassified Actinoplanes TaxID=2626549 RepID=UPI00023EC1FD|nr:MULTISPECIES: Tripartite motif-containing protein 71 [unclassified Actinoplanes]AEV81877.1 Tripartite motif-containing protein 71 [Actinoplanes sp. SE50/110]ATO80278.1 Tripartite motif-containing protein 71 [Actinoplanes sp. SE50]